MNSSFTYDTTYRIESYNIQSTTKTIPELYNLEYKEYIDEYNNQLIYEYDLKEKDIYVIFQNKVELYSIYPNVQLPNDLNIEYDFI